MSLRRKTFLAISLTLAGLIVIVYLVISTTMLNSFAALDRQSALRGVDRTTSIFQDNVDNLASAVGDWSSWDETYQFALDGNPEYIADNLEDDTFWGLNVNLMVFLDAANQIVYAKAVDIHSDWQNSIVQNFEAYSRENETFLRLTTSVPTSGFVVIGDEPLLIASRPILHNDETGPIAGTLIWGQHLAPNELSATERSLRLTLDLRPVDPPNLSEDMRAATLDLSPATLRTTALLSEETIAGYAFVNDIYGQPTLLVRTTQERNAYQQGMPSLLTILVALVVVAVFFGAGILLLLERLLLARLTRLSEQAHMISVNHDFSLRLTASGDDDLTQLANALNMVLNTVSSSREALQESATHLKIQGSERTAELEHQKSSLQAIMDTMGEGLVQCIDGRITYVNRAFVNLLDYEASDLVGKPFSALNRSTDPAQTPVYFTTPRRYETTLTRRDGTGIDAAINSTPVDQGDKHESQVIIVRDITQELAAKRQKDYFFARASHDLRSPLASIMTRLYLLSKKPEQLETHLTSLNHVSNMMLELVNDLLDVSRFERGANTLKRRDLVLQTIIDQVVEIQQLDAGMKNIDLIAHSIELPLNVYSNPLRLTQLFTNLVSNALHYTPEGGQIVVDVGLDELNGEKCALINVSDTGIGIDSESLPHVFDAFFRVENQHENEGGSGLGLYIVREIVQLHGGEISVSSEPGTGTTFSVRLQLSGRQARNEAISSDAPVTA
ncbi:MAG: CHASE4 domain-containing protein [Chloroflexota bacterium]